MDKTPQEDWGGNEIQNKGKNMYEYNATLDRVVDGDTVDLNIDLGFDVWLQGKRVRLNHVDTPEKRTRDLLEKHFGNLATKYIEDKLNNAEYITVETQLDGELDKYGRILGSIYVDEETTSLNVQLIERRLAVMYEGQNKKDVEDEHINNMTFLVDNKHVVLPSDIRALYEESKS